MVNVKERRMIIMDSLGLRYQKLEGIFQSFFQKVAQEIGGESKLEIQYADCFPQSDHSSCGLHCIVNVLSALNDKSFEDISSKSVDIRRSIIFALCAHLGDK